MAEGWDWERLPGDESEDEDDGEEYLVEKIVTKRVLLTGTEYFIKWAGYPESQNTWEPQANIHCKDILGEFERNWAKDREGKPKPVSVRPASPLPSTSKCTLTLTSASVSGINGDNSESSQTGGKTAAIKREATANPKPTTLTSGFQTGTRADSNNFETDAEDLVSVKTKASLPKKPRIEHIFEDDKRREILNAVEKRRIEDETRRLQDHTVFERMKARQEKIEKTQEVVERAGGFKPVFRWQV